MYFQAPVCADLIRLLAHACAWENITKSCFVIPSMLCQHVIESEMYFQVPVCAELIRVLAHACAWENITKSCFVIPSTLC